MRRILAVVFLLSNFSSFLLASSELIETDFGLEEFFDVTEDYTCNDSMDADTGASSNEPAIELPSALDLSEREMAAVFFWESHPEIHQFFLPNAAHSVPLNLLISEHSNIAAIHVGGVRLEFDHNWPHISAERVQMSEFMIWLYRQFSLLIFDPQKLNIISHILSFNLIDWTRPVLKISEGRQKYFTFLDILLMAKSFDFQIFKTLLAAFPKELINCHEGHGFTALNIAVYRGHVEAVRELLAAGADPNIIAGEKGSAPFLATVLGHSQIITELALSRRVTPCLEDSEKYNLLHLMLKCNRPEAVLFFTFSKRVKIATCVHILVTFYENRKTFGLQCINHALLHPNRELFSQLLAHFVNIGDLEVAKTIVQAQPNLNWIITTKAGLIKTTLLHIAAKSGNLEMVKFVITTFDSKDIQDSDKLFASEIALKNNCSKEVLNAILPTAGIESLTASLVRALKENKLDLVTLIAKQIPTLNRIYVAGISLPCFVARKGEPKALWALLWNGNFDPFAVDRAGNALATLSGCSEAMKAVIDNYTSHHQFKAAQRDANSDRNA